MMRYRVTIDDQCCALLAWEPGTTETERLAVTPDEMREAIRQALQGWWEARGLDPSAEEWKALGDAADALAHLYAETP
jgi:hypothetical protein